MIGGWGLGSEMLGSCTDTDTLVWYLVVHRQETDDWGGRVVKCWNFVPNILRSDILFFSLFWASAPWHIVNLNPEKVQTGFRTPTTPDFPALCGSFYIIIKVGDVNIWQFIPLISTRNPSNYYNTSSRQQHILLCNLVVDRNIDKQNILWSWLLMQSFGIFSFGYFGVFLGSFGMFLIYHTRIFLVFSFVNSRFSHRDFSFEISGLSFWDFSRFWIFLLSYSRFFSFVVSDGFLLWFRIFSHSKILVFWFIILGFFSFHISGFFS